MSLTVTPNLTDSTVSLCNEITSWAGGIQQFAVEPNVKVEGTNSLCAWIDATTSAIEYFALPATVDMSDGMHVYVWMYCSGIVDTRANGGFRIVLYSGTTNYATFFVGGNDSHKAKWNLVFCDASATPDLETGTFDPSAVTHIGIQFKTLTNAIKKGQTFVQNCFWDAIRWGYGLTITSGSSDQITPQDIADADTTSNGIVQIINGAAVISGKLVFGGTGTENIDFVADNWIMVYPDNPYASDDLNTILVLGNGTGITNFNILGSFIKALTKPAVLAFSGENINELNVLGSTLVTIGESEFIDNEVVEDSVFANSGVIKPNGATFNRVTIKDTIETLLASLYLTSQADAELCTNITFNRFSNSYAVYITSAVTEFDMDNWVFDDPDNTASYALYWAGTNGTLTINAKNGTNLTSSGCTSAGGTVIVTNPKVFKFTLNPSITGYEWRIYSVTAMGSLAGAVELDGEESASVDNQTYNYEYSSDVIIAVQILAILQDYEESVTYYRLSNSDQDITILLTRDENN